MKSLRSDFDFRLRLDVRDILANTFLIELKYRLL